MRPSASKEITTGSRINGSAATSSTRNPGARTNFDIDSSGDNAGAGGATTPSADCSVGPVVGLVDGRVTGRVTGCVAGAVAGGTAACGFARFSGARFFSDAHAVSRNAQQSATDTTPTTSALECATRMLLECA